MKNRRPHLRFVLVFGVLLFLFILATGPPPCTAATIWSDDFNDGDHAGWTIESGDYGVSSNTLIPTATDSTIRHSSTVTTGTWSFDFLWLGTSAWVAFIASSTFGTNNSYHIEFERNTGTNVSTVRIHAYVDTDHTAIITAQNEAIDPLYGSWVSVAITRDASGEFLAYINGIPVWRPPPNVIHTTHTTSSFFVIHCLETTFAFDNIVVSDSVDITLPPLPIPGFPAAAIALGMITSLGLGIVTRRYRKHS